MLIICPKCKHKWNTKSKLDYITCPNCQRRFEKEDGIIEREVTEEESNGAG